MRGERSTRHSRSIDLGEPMTRCQRHLVLTDAALAHLQGNPSPIQARKVTSAKSSGRTNAFLTLSAARLMGADCIISGIDR